ncbi:MAG: hypothetical protein ABI123_08555 [Ginsengibacter sp.]
MLTSTNKKDNTTASAPKKNQGFFFQPKLSINHPNHMYEKEADGMADMVTVLQPPSLHQIRSGSTLTDQFFIQRAPASSSLSIPAVIPGQVGPRYLSSGIISRPEFDTYVKSNYGVKDVHTGTQTDQEIRTRTSVIFNVTISSWQHWDPGSVSEGYTNIIEGIEDMINSIGAFPAINNIVFFKQAYEANASGIGVARPSIGADFGAGVLTIYESYSGAHRFPLARSQPAVATPVEANNSEMFIRQNIAHELGHGVGEAAMASQNLQTFNEYKAAIGWVGAPAVLYDIGQQTVRDAIANNTPLPVQHIITASGWNDSTVIEQPMTMYSVIGGPGEDFAETITAFIYQPLALMQRSPRRYSFIQANMNTWKTQMQSITSGIQRPKLGDFPELGGDERVV